MSTHTEISPAGENVKGDLTPRPRPNPWFRQKVAEGKFPGLKMEGDKVVSTRPEAEARPRKRSRLMTWKALESLPEPEWLVEDILPASSMSVVYSEPGAGKTFLALEYALTLTTHGKRVVYIVGEGGASFSKRIRAWLAEQGLVDEELPGLLVHHGPVNMADQADSFADEVEAAGLHPDLLVVDTLNRCYGSGDENSTRDMKRFVDGCDVFKYRFGAAVLILHHSGKDERRGARGNSSLKGATDMEAHLFEAKSGELVLLCEKMKDWEEFSARAWERAKAHGSCVLRPTAVPAKPKKGSNIPAGATKKALECLPADGEPIPAHEWFKRCLAAGLTTSKDEESRARVFRRVKQTLVDDGLVRVEGENVSKVIETP